MALLQSYQGKYNEQKVFVSQMSAQVESMKSVSRMDSMEMHHAIESSTVSIFIKSLKLLILTFFHISCYKDVIVYICYVRFS